MTAKRAESAGIAGRIGGYCLKVMGAVGKRRLSYRTRPPRCLRRIAEQRRPVIDLNSTVGFRRAGERQRVVIGNAVAHYPAVGRERDDGRGHRRNRIDGRAQSS